VASTASGAASALISESSSASTGGSPQGSGSHFGAASGSAQSVSPAAQGQAFSPDVGQQPFASPALPANAKTSDQVLHAASASTVRATPELEWTAGSGRSITEVLSRPSIGTEFAENSVNTNVFHSNGSVPSAALNRAISLAITILLASAGMALLGAGLGRSYALGISRVGRARRF
jgi:hypothetical protein